jgi:hypothetical protein
VACHKAGSELQTSSFIWFSRLYQSTKTGKIFSKKCISGTKSKYNMHSKSQFCFNIQHVKKIMQINYTSQRFQTTADTVVCHISLLSVGWKKKPE